MQKKKSISYEFLFTGSQIFLIQTLSYTSAPDLKAKTHRTPVEYWRWKENFALKENLLSKLDESLNMIMKSHVRGKYMHEREEILASFTQSIDP